DDILRTLTATIKNYGQKNTPSSFGVVKKEICPKIETMTGQIQNKHEALMQKQEILEHSKNTIKREYIGIDRTIDQVVDAISPWYLFPDLQETPVIINLWGLTGVGKSSLVNRLSQLIGFDKKYYNFDLGKDSNWDFVIEEIYEYSELSPVILAFDEFQHARTL